MTKSAKKCQLWYREGFLFGLMSEGETKERLFYFIAANFLRKPGFVGRRSMHVFNNEPTTHIPGIENKKQRQHMRGLCNLRLSAVWTLYNCSR